MKKILFLFLGLVILGVSACRKEYITNTTPNQTIYYTLNNSNWSLSGDGKTYLASIPFASSDIYLNQYDGLLLYISYDSGKTYISVPQTYNGLSYSYSVDNDKVYIEVQNSDGSVGVSNPGNMTAKVVLIPSQE
ncbi:MAG: hypothetical protein ABIP95_00630 [Pelobium sp.]